MSGALEAGSSLAYGFASAFVPLFNVEAYVGVYASLAPLSLFAVVFTVGLGQTLGKVALFEGARRGQDLARARTADRRPSDRAVVRRVRAWGARLMRLLDDRRAGPATVLVSASIGVPRWQRSASRPARRLSAGWSSRCAA